MYDSTLSIHYQCTNSIRMCIRKQPLREILLSGAVGWGRGVGWKKGVRPSPGKFGGFERTGVRIILNGVGIVFLFERFVPLVTAVLPQPQTRHHLNLSPAPH